MERWPKTHRQQISLLYARYDWTTHFAISLLSVRSVGDKKNCKIIAGILLWARKTDIRLDTPVGIMVAKTYLKWLGKVLVESGLN